MITKTFVALALFTVSAAAGTLTVGPAGTGADFTELTTAVAAAAPGDVLLVAPGQYSSTATVVVNKPLTILGAGSDVTRVESLPAFPVLDSLPLYVVGLAAGEEVRIAGLGLHAASFGGEFATAFVIENCVGPVVLADISTGAEGMIGDSPGLGQIRGSAQVVLDGCELRVLGGASNTPPTPALRIENSEVHINGCVLRGGTQGTLLSQGTEHDGAPGILATSSVVRLSRTAVRGGDGTASSVFFTPTTPTAGGAAIEATSSQIYVRGGSGNDLLGGTGKSAIAGGVLVHGQGGAAVAADPASLVTSTLDAVLTSGADSTFVVTTPIVDGGSPYFALGTALATLASTTKLAAPGTSVTLELGGQPGALFLTYFSLLQGPATATPAIYGQILLDTQSASLLGSTLLDATGAGSLGVAIPSLPSLVGLSVVAQGFSSGGGPPSFSSPTFVGIR